MAQRISWCNLGTLHLCLPKHLSTLKQLTSFDTTIHSRLNRRCSDGSRPTAAGPWPIVMARPRSVSSTVAGLPSSVTGWRVSQASTAAACAAQSACSCLRLGQNKVMRVYLESIVPTSARLQLIKWQTLQATWLCLACVLHCNTTGNSPQV